jgi:hypothetical protein
VKSEVKLQVRAVLDIHRHGMRLCRHCGDSNLCQRTAASKPRRYHVTVIQSSFPRVTSFVLRGARAS